MQPRLVRIKQRAKTRPRTAFDAQLPEFVDRFVALPQPAAPHDAQIRIAIEQAVLAANLGNFAVGAVLFDSSGKVMQRGEARVLRPYHRSDLHAEMVVLSRYEERMKFRSLKQRNAKMNGSVLFSSLEPCPMCFARLILSGVNQIYYAAEELRGGMVHLFDNLPEIWRQIFNEQGKKAALADCSPEYKKLAFDIFLASAMASQNDQNWPWK